ncbi:MAG: MBL fold metallo-hydrolase [Patescibacteria group bacterium]
MKITFYGGAKTVTGANYLLESGDTKILIDCGLSQGNKEAERKNFEPLPYNPSSVQALFITHAHVDHVGKIPKLVKSGFDGAIYSTPPTKDFAELLLLDSEHLLRREAEEEGRAPLYLEEDVLRAMTQWKTQDYHSPFEIGPFVVEFFDAGHILGSASIKFTAEGKSIIFSGDLGNAPAPVIRDPDPLPAADYCVIESTYGDRVHDSADTRESELENAIEDTVRAGGVLMVPAFAMERTQDLLYHLNGLVEQGRVPRVPVYIDSPLAIRLTDVYKKYKEYFNRSVTKEMRAGDDILNFPGLHFTLTAEQSKEINNVHPPKIIIAGSGMSNGGRILHHERRYLSDPKSCLLIVGYQAAGTMGRALVDGAKTVRMFKEEIPVRCSIRSITAYSAHADQPHLLAWLRPRRGSLKEVFVVQGEEEGAMVLAQKIRDELAVQASVPSYGEEFML